MRKQTLGSAEKCSLKTVNAYYGDGHLPQADIKKSILECREIYKELTDLQFATWYGRRFGVKGGEVMAVLRREANGE